MQGAEVEGLAVYAALHLSQRAHAHHASCIMHHLISITSQMLSQVKCYHKTSALISQALSHVLGPPHEGRAACRTHMRKQMTCANK